ncbi:MAG: hypothetical protein U0228_26260 [Myxococcaceae bacterium]
MLTTLLLSMALSQTPAQDFSAPPMVEVPALRRSARLIPQREARVDAASLTGRVGMSMTLGLVGSAAGAALFTGAVLLGASAGSWAGVFTGILLGVAVSPIVVGLGVLGVALGSALFGEHLGADFIDALKISGITVPSAVAVAVLLLAVGINPLLAIAVPFLAATISTPLFVQWGKPEVARAQPLRPEGAGVVGNEGGLTIGF